MTTPLPIDEFQELLTCQLCKGFYRDAHTILECMHTFCKSCILVHFHENNSRGSIQCPQCNVNLGLYGHLATKMIYDRDLQSIVDKIFPQFAENEKLAEEIFYKERNIDLKSTGKRKLDEDQFQSNTKHVKQEDVDKQAIVETKPEVEIIIKIVPAKVCPENLRLPLLTKSLCKATKSVKMIKLKNFVYKRMVDEAVRRNIKPEEIQLSHNGKTYADDAKLAILGDEIEEAIQKNAHIELEYCRIKPFAGDI